MIYQRRLYSDTTIELIALFGRLNPGLIAKRTLPLFALITNAKVITIPANVIIPRDVNRAFYFQT